MKKENVDVVFRSTLTNQHYYPTGYWKRIIVWHVVPLLGNDRAISKYTTAITM
jgi:hypothetical protein